MLLKYRQLLVPPLATTQCREHVTGLCYKYMTIIKKKGSPCLIYVCRLSRRIRSWWRL